MNYQPGMWGYMEISLYFPSLWQSKSLRKLQVHYLGLQVFLITCFFGLFQCVAFCRFYIDIIHKIVFQIFQMLDVHCDQLCSNSVVALYERTQQGFFGLNTSLRSLKTANFSVMCSKFNKLLRIKLTFKIIIINRLYHVGVTCVRFRVASRQSLEKQCIKTHSPKPN